MVHKHTVRDTGAHFTIDPFTRQVKNDSTTKTTIVQFDHNSERLTFELPVLDGHAATLCDLIEIHYINISADGKNQNAGVYEVDDIKADGEKTIFTWLISQEATQLAGSLNFFIVLKCTENGVTVYRWGTEIFKNLPVSDGMNNGEAVLTEYPDILAQWKTQLFDASNTAVSNVATAEAKALAAIEEAGEAKKQSVLASIPDEYEILSQNVDTNIAKIRTLASGIKGNASGAVIRVDDVSPVGHNLVVNVHGKNMIPFPYAEKTITKDGVTFTVNEDGGITVSGTPTFNTSFNLVMQYQKKLSLKKGKVYTISCVSTLTSASGYVYVQNWTDGVGADSLSVRKGGVTFTASKDGYAQIGVVLLKNQPFNETIYIQLEEGTAATEYTPYIDPSTVTVSRHGKNLACGATTQTITSKGINISRTEGSSKLIIDGTAEGITSAIAMKSVLLPPGTYTVSVHGLNTNSENEDRAYVWDQEKEKVIVNYIMTNAPKTFTINEPCYARIEIVFGAATTYTNKTVLLQLEAGGTATEYEPYIGETYTPGEGGVVPDVASLSPTMTILTNKKGITVDCEYIVDTKTYIDNKIAEALKGSD